jgi:hypothetical protein
LLSILELNNSIWKKGILIIFSFFTNAKSVRPILWVIQLFVGLTILTNSEQNYVHILHFAFECSERTQHTCGAVSSVRKIEIMFGWVLKWQSFKTQIRSSEGLVRFGFSVAPYRGCYWVRISCRVNAKGLMSNVLFAYGRKESKPHNGQYFTERNTIDPVINTSNDTITVSITYKRCSYKHIPPLVVEIRILKSFDRKHSITYSLNLFINVH